MKNKHEIPNTTDRSGFDPPLINPRTATKRLGTSTWRVRRLVTQRRIPHYNICGKIRFSSDEIRAWLDERTARAATPTRRGRP